MAPREAVLDDDRVMPSPRPEKWLTVAQVAELLSVNQQTVYRWIWSGELKSHRFGARSRWIRVSEQDLARWQDGNRWTP
ncbi:helix-turn-helix domain-containing protein [Tsukamurella tyrosinosolvens]|uniref:helix-turn-helix domain-containing protein n=1 Tax=Tsukamurella tyrosinosolvens TaxID=57704 RepID=UPI0034637803